MSRSGGKQWLAHDLEERRVVALELGDQVIAGARESTENMAAFIVHHFRFLDKLLREYDCTDLQEDCDRDKAVLAVRADSCR